MNRLDGSRNLFTPQQGKTNTPSYIGKQVIDAVWPLIVPVEWWRCVQTQVKYKPLKRRVQFEPRCSAAVTGAWVDVCSQLVNHYYCLLFFTQDLNWSCFSWRTLLSFFFFCFVLKYSNHDNVHQVQTIRLKLYRRQRPDWCKPPTKAKKMWQTKKQCYLMSQSPFFCFKLSQLFPEGTSLSWSSPVLSSFISQLGVF